MYIKKLFPSEMAMCEEKILFYAQTVVQITSWIVVETDFSLIGKDKRVLGSKNAC